jgi:hypothetical protein
MATDTRQKLRGLRELQSYRLALPTGTVLPSGLPAALEDLEPTTPDESSAGISVEYPRLCRRLRDLGLRFQLAYNQPVAARITGKSERTLREWSRQGKIACHRCSGIASTPSPYYTARSLESYLSQRERGKA